MEAFRGGADEKYTCSMNTMEFKITRALEPYVALLRGDIDDKMSDSCMRAKMEQMKEKRNNVDKAMKMIDEIKQVPLMNLAISANADDAFDFGEDDAFDFGEGDAFDFSEDDAIKALRVRHDEFHLP